MIRAEPVWVARSHELTRWSVIAEGIRGEVDEREEHDTNTCTQIGYSRWPEPPIR